MTTETLYVTGNGGVVTGWDHEGVSPTNTHYAYVDEQGAHDGMATRLYSPVTGDIISFTFQDLAAVNRTVESVTVTSVMMKLDPVAANSRKFLRIAGVNYFGPEQSPTTNNVWEALPHTWTTNPATGSAWTVADVNALEAGVEKVNAAGQRLTQVYLTVELGGPAVKGRATYTVTSSTVTVASSKFTEVGVAVGDLLVVALSIDGTRTPTTTSTGWSRLYLQTTGGGTAAQTLTAFAKIATSTTESLVVAVGASEAVAAIVWCVGDHGLADVSEIQSSAAASSTIPARTMADAKGYVALSAVGAYLAGDVPTAPSGWTNWTTATVGTTTGGSRISGGEKYGLGPGTITGGSSSDADVTSSLLVPAAGSAPSSVLGDLVAAVLAPTASLTGSTSNPAAMNAGPPRATASLVGATPDNLGTLAPSVLKPMASLAGSASNPGALSPSVLKPTASLAGSSSNPASLAPSVLRPTAALAGTSSHQATLAAATLKPQAVLTGSATNPGTLSPAVRPRASLSGTQRNPATLAATTRKPTASLAAAAINPATLAATALKPQAVLVEANVGTLAAAALKPQAALAGSASNPGALAPSVPRPTSSLAGSSRNAGTLTATTLKPTATLGTTNAGTLAPSVPRPTMALTGSATNAGALAADTPRTASALAGTPRNPAAMAAATPRPTSGLAGSSSNPGALAPSVLKLQATMAAGSIVTGSLAATTLKPTASLAGATRNPGALAGSAPRATAALGTTNQATLAATAPRATSGLSGTARNAGALAGVLEVPAAVLEAQAVNQAVLDTSTAPPLAAITAGATNAADLAATLLAIVLAAQGNVGGRVLNVQVGLGHWAYGPIPALTGDPLQARSRARQGGVRMARHPFSAYLRKDSHG